MRVGETEATNLDPASAGVDIFGHTSGLTLSVGAFVWLALAIIVLLGALVAIQRARPSVAKPRRTRWASPWASGRAE